MELTGEFEDFAGLRVDKLCEVIMLFLLNYNDHTCSFGVGVGTHICARAWLMAIPLVKSSTVPWGTVMLNVFS